MNTASAVLLGSFFLILAGFVLAEFRSREFNSLGTVNVASGQEYEDEVYDNDMSCGLQCLTAGRCQTFAVAKADGRGFNCVFDVAEEDLPRGRWNIYVRPGKVILKSNHHYHEVYHLYCLL